MWHGALNLHAEQFRYLTSSIARRDVRTGTMAELTDVAEVNGRTDWHRRSRRADKRADSAVRGTRAGVQGVLT